jgi:hypothetical protein
MIKVRILDRCEACAGEAYVYVCEAVDANGDSFDRYRPCEMCHGSGNQASWISLRDLSNLIERAIAMEPDNLELEREKLVSHYQASRDLTFLSTSTQKIPPYSPSSNKNICAINEIEIHPSCSPPFHHPRRLLHGKFILIIFLLKIKPAPHIGTPSTLASWRTF